MSGTTETTPKAKPPRKPRAWWQYLFGISLLGAAAVSAVMRWVPAFHKPTPVSIQPREIKVLPELKAVDAIPVSPGELAGCNLLLVTFDTTRADRVGCYGNDSIETPSLDRLAREGVLCSRAIAPAPVTLPSHSSMLTGLYPSHHGVRANSWFSLAEGHTTLAEVLREQGYRTAAMVSTFVLDARFGVAQGFEVFNDETEDAEDAAQQLRVAQRSGDATCDLAIEWLQGHAAEKFFLWVHFYDPHWPYEAPEPYVLKSENVYDAEIAFTDVQLGRLLGLLDELELTEKTLVVLAGDHGESLGQHNEQSHALLIYDPTARVPLLLRCGKRLGAGVCLDRLTSLVDIMPTALSLLGVEGPENMDGVDLTQPSDEDRAVFIETFQGLTEHGCSPLLGLYEGTMKYIFGPEIEMYDLSKDPFEEKNVVSSGRQIAAALDQRLKEFFGSDLEEATNVQPTQTLSSADVAKLQALGYIGAAGGEVLPPQERTNPKEFVIQYRDFQIIKSKLLYAKADPDEAIEMLEEFIEENPSFKLAFQYLGQCYFLKGNYAKAEKIWRHCWELQPGMPRPLLSIAAMKTLQKEFEEAIALFRLSLEHAPDDVTALRQLGWLLLERGRYAEALGPLKRAAELLPDDEDLPDMLITAALRTDRLDEINEMFHQQLQSDPKLAMVRNAIAGICVIRKQWKEAEALLREGARITPDRFKLISNLAVLLVSCQDETIRSPVEATLMMERVCEKTRFEDPLHLRTLGMVYAQSLRLDEAIAVTERALKIASASERPEFHLAVPAIEHDIKRYRQAKAEGFSPMADPTRAQPADTIGPKQDDLPTGGG